MQIINQQKLLPFSHIPGMKVLIPGSPYMAEIFPCLIRLVDWNRVEPVLMLEIHLELPRFFQEFTICMDVERGSIRVWGKSEKGYVEYHLKAGKREGIAFYLDRAPSSGVALEIAQTRYYLRVKESMSLLSENANFAPSEKIVSEKLFFGMHKKLDWEAVQRRLLLSEIFPIWHRLGQWTSYLDLPIAKGGVFDLLNECKELHGIEAEDRWLDVIRVGFSDFFVPQCQDVHHLGIPLTPMDSFSSPLALLSEGTRAIRNLFIQREGTTISILPILLPSLHAGRLLNVTLSEGLTCSMEWTKKTIRQMIIRSDSEQEVFLRCKSNIRSFRLRRSKLDRGKRVNATSSIQFLAGSELFFDNFE